MGCLPESGGCERQRTDPFVDHLNRSEGTNYVHSVCLDVVYRNSPQPEALYNDDGSGRRLVIERKNLIWPPEYALGHKNDHFLVDLVSDGLKDFIADDAYELHLDFGVSGTTVELEEFARVIVQKVRARFPEILVGNKVGSTQEGRRWAFWRGDRASRTFDGAPETGLGVRWDVPVPANTDSEPPDGFVGELSRLFGSCVRKFGPYMDARRILLIEQHGDMRYMGAWWWKRVLDATKPPPEISELWDSMFDWLDDSEKGWTFEKLYPTTATTPM
jgi:hypothetical protein